MLLDFVIFFFYTTKHTDSVHHFNFAEPKIWSNLSIEQNLYEIIEFEVKTLLKYPNSAFCIGDQSSDGAFSENPRGVQGDGGANDQPPHRLRIQRERRSQHQWVYRRRW